MVSRSISQPSFSFIVSPHVWLHPARHHCCCRAFSGTLPLFFRFLIGYRALRLRGYIAIYWLCVHMTSPGSLHMRLDLDKIILTYCLCVREFWFFFNWRPKKSIPPSVWTRSKLMYFFLLTFPFKPESWTFTPFSFEGWCEIMVKLLYRLAITHNSGLFLSVTPKGQSLL